MQPSWKSVYYVLKCPVSATHSSIQKCIPTQLIFHSIYKWKSTFLVINGHTAVKACPLSPAWSLSYSFFPLTHSASPCFLPFEALFFLFDEDRRFPCVKQFKARVARAIKARFVGSPTPTHLFTQPCKREARMLWLASPNFFTLLVFVAVAWSSVDDNCSPCCRLLIVKSGRSWGISPGRALYPRLWTCSRFRFWRLGREMMEGGKVLNFMRRTPHPIVSRWRQKAAGIF